MRPSNIEGPGGWKITGPDTVGIVGVFLLLLSLGVSGLGMSAPASAQRALLWLGLGLVVCWAAVRLLVLPILKGRHSGH